MTAPGPVAGNNPYILAYQTGQFDSTVPPAKSVLDVLSTPSGSGITAETSPTHAFLEDTNPPIGAGDNEPGGGH